MFTLLTLSIVNAQDTIYVSQNAIGTNDGTSWTNAYTDLQTAYTASVSGDEVWVAAGTYLPGNTTSSTFSLKMNVAMYGGFSGNEIVRSGVRDASITILSGDVDSDSTWSAGDIEHIVDATESDTSSILDGFTLEGGNSPNNWGGAITCYNSGVNPGGVSVNNCILNRNYAKFGGAVYNQANAIAYMDFTNCIFSNNECSNYGGAIQNETAGYMNIINCTFYNNSAGSGANVINDNTNKTSIFNSIIWDNNGTANMFYNMPITTNSIIEGGYASGTNIIDSNPLFVDASLGNFRLQACSPAIDSGNTSGIMSYLNNYDLDYNERISNTIDIGAYEFAIKNSVTLSNLTLSTNAAGANITYQWLNCDDNTILLGNTNSSFTATTNGNYAVVVTDNSCRVDTSACSYVAVIVLVNTINVQSETGDSTISTLGGTLQMEATVLPINADDMTYAWSVVSGTGSALLSASGLLTAVTGGTVIVTATANDASGMVGSKTITISNQSVGITESSFEALTVYPNPTNGILNIDTEENIESVKIIDYTGKTVKIFDGKNTQIDISDINNGIYIVEIANTQKKSIIKLLKK